MRTSSRTVWLKRKPLVTDRLTDQFPGPRIRPGFALPGRNVAVVIEETGTAANWLRSRYQPRVAIIVEHRIVTDEIGSAVGDSGRLRHAQGNARACRENAGDLPAAEDL